MSFFRRFPLPVRPIPFAGGLLLMVLGILRGLNWAWGIVPEGGQFRLSIVSGASLFAFDLVHVFWLFTLVLGMFWMSFAFVRSDPNDLGPFGSRATFYPTLFVLALFLSFFGLFYLFDVSEFADATPGGFVVLHYFDYAGLLERPIKGLIGVLSLVAGLTLLFGFAFDSYRWRALVHRPSPPVPTQVLAPTTVAQLVGSQNAATPQPVRRVRYAAPAQRVDDGRKT